MEIDLTYNRTSANRAVVRRRKKIIKKTNQNS